MTVLVGFLAGAVAGALGWLLLQPMFDAQVFARTNHRGARVATGAGVVIVLSVLVSEAVLQLAESLDWEPNAVTDAPRAAVLILALGLGFLGLLDDLAGAGESGGFRGHLGAMVHGRFTTGTVKLFGGAAVAVVAVQGPRADTLGRVLADAALIALCANLANLFDRAPGRTLKVSLLAFVALVAATGAPAELLGVAVALGAGAGLLWPDLRERLMLGDAGANVLGGVLGLGVVIATAPVTRTVVLLGVLALNLASEAVSFSNVIDRVAPLRALDRAGRIPGSGT
jgi:UDP-GlcNAc:undecaprenyl-phosphate/decaprenyl-phosphate GlcNAc-1-phosphate transferase